MEFLPENLLKALQSMMVGTIRRWEHRIWCWLDAYDGGMGAREAQLQVQSFSLQKYKSHQWVWGFGSMDDYIILSLYGNLSVWPILLRPKKIT